MPRFALLAALLAPAVVLADAKNPTYDADVLPVLKQHCVSCHGPDKQKSGLKLDTFANLKLGGSGGDAVVPGSPDKSMLYTFTAHKAKPEMPPAPAAKIPDAQIELIRLWVEQGAKENAGSKVAMPDKPKVDIGLKSVGKGKPEGPPPMPAAGKLKPDPLSRARRPGAVTAMAASPWAPLLAVSGQKQVLLYHTDTGDFLGSLAVRARADQQPEIQPQRQALAGRRRAGRGERAGGAVQRRDVRESDRGGHRDGCVAGCGHLRRPDDDRRRLAERSSSASTPPPTARCCTK